MIGECRIVRLIKKGGMGEVYLAEDLKLPRRVAVKTLRGELVDEEMTKRFINEAAALAKASHPNVVAIYDIGRERGLYFIKMQYVEGRDLSELIKAQGGPLAWRSALRIIRLAAKGLQAVHNQNLLHRDIKPANIMYSNDARVLVMDFGLVREHDAGELTVPGGVVGTPPYMAPEQCQSRFKLDERCDVYALGATLYFLLTARSPFEGTVVEVMTQKATGRKPSPVTELNPHVPHAVSDFLSRAMAVQRERRPATASQFQKEVDELLKSAPEPPLTERETSGVSASIGETQPLPELAPLQLIPLDPSLDEPLRRYVPWVIGICAVVGIAALVIGLRIAYPPDAPPAPSIAAQKTIHAHPGMVRIEKGWVEVGASRERIITFFRQFPNIKEGSDDFDTAVEGNLAEVPARKEVAAFWIDQYEVTNAEYAKFIRKTGRRPPEHWNGAEPPPGEDNFPVVMVTYDDAAAYAAFVGKKLPTTEQWVRAFRGDKSTLFPWGDDYRSNWVNCRENTSFTGLAAVDATPQDVSPFQVFNLVGNVAEYIRDPIPHPASDPDVHYAKGNCFSQPGYVQGIATFRWTCLMPTDRLGFRCVVEE